VVKERGEQPEQWVKSRVISTVASRDSFVRTPRAGYEGLGRPLGVEMIGIKILGYPICRRYGLFSLRAVHA
jgi:hypothetical protein